MAAVVIPVFSAGDVTAARRTAKAEAAALGFAAQESEEIALVVSELASNLVKHARRGIMTLTPLATSGRAGIQIESEDHGPGIADVERAIADGFSTAGSLGDGLGVVNRLMDELDVVSEPGRGTFVVCKRWARTSAPSMTPCPLAFGAATRVHPSMNVNGDAFVVKTWDAALLVAVIDGLGHGQFAHRAAQTARRYVDTHFDQPPAEIFRGVGRACHATRGVVMAIARFDWARGRLTFASVGNVQARVFDSPEPMHFIVRRGILGVNAPNPLVSEHCWEPTSVMVLHSDGLKTNWNWETFRHFANGSATTLAQQLLRALAKEDDDATVVVVKGRQPETDGKEQQ